MRIHYLNDLREWSASKAACTFTKILNMDVGYWIEVLVENKVIIDVKLFGSLAPVHCAQDLKNL